MKSILEKTKSTIGTFVRNSRETVILNSIKLLIHASMARNLLFKRLEREIKEIIYEKELSGVPYIKKVKAQYLIALIKQGKKNIDKGIISKNYISKLMKLMLLNLFYKETSKKVKQRFEQNYGFLSPAFCAISPTQRCNLKCAGCYSVSDKTKKSSLPYWIVKKLVGDMRDLVGARFIVLSGGEPFLWNDNGRGIIDLAKEFPDMYFLAYTNGLFLDNERIKSLMEAGNLTPAISVEGYEKETDQRRGPGVFKKILRNIENLKKHGLPFCVSLTASKNNINLLYDDALYKYWLDEIGAMLIWVFHIMPIGRAKDTLELMISAEERKKLLHKWEYLLFEKDYFVADFWNSGAASEGCMAYARGGGYFHVDWNGNLNPCVFVPYAKDNIYDLYKSGKTIVNGITSDYFNRGREWQKNYGLLCKKPKNFFAPCSIRDHHAYFRKKILKEDIRPSYDKAAEALKDPEYFRILNEFDKELWKLTDSIWEERLK
jgi:MoaA/NifB/PqqE/SkfB family radical SAM enzyme